MRLLVTGGIYLERIDGRRRMGGSALTAALAAAAHGAQVSLASWIGQAEAEETFALLDAAGVERLAVQVLDGATSEFHIGDARDLSMPSPRIVQGAVPGEHRPALPSARTVLCFGTLGFDVIRARWLDRAAEGATLLFDRQGARSLVMGAQMAATVPAARRILLANVHEALAETNTGNLARALERLPPKDFDAAVVKAGPWGANLLADGALTPIGAHAVPVHNTIGSGDVFAGALAAQLALGEELPAAAHGAARAAAAWITSEDDHPSGDLPRRAAAYAGEPATWVDRRGLEERRFALRFDPAHEQSLRGPTVRALRYLGMETVCSMTDTPVLLDLTHSTHTPRDGVAQTVADTIAWVRETFGASPTTSGAD